jgi:hypothetical protein
VTRDRAIAAITFPRENPHSAGAVRHAIGAGFERACDVRAPRIMSLDYGKVGSVWVSWMHCWGR